MCSSRRSRSSRRPVRAADAERSRSRDDGGVGTMSSSRMVRRSRSSPGGFRRGTLRDASRAAVALADKAARVGRRADVTAGLFGRAAPVRALVAPALRALTPVLALRARLALLAPLARVALPALLALPDVLALPALLGLPARLAALLAPLAVAALRVATCQRPEEKATMGSWTTRSASRRSSCSSTSSSSSPSRS